MLKELDRWILFLALTVFAFGVSISSGNDSGQACQAIREAPEASTLSCNSTACIAVCLAKYKFPKGETSLGIDCTNGKWVIKSPKYKNLATLPGCSPVCNPACANKGKCIAPNRCQCTADFQGPTCREKACRNPPAMTRNAKRTCHPSRCTVMCMPGFKYKNLATTMNLQCRNGNWVSVTKNLPWNSHCEPHCGKKCLNGGECVGPNNCKCPGDFVGPQCQHTKDKCSMKKIGFNGSYQCVGNQEQLSCSLKCPEGIEFEYPPEPMYKCKFETGVFTPSTAPKCVFGENAVLQTVNQLQETPQSLTKVDAFQCNPQCMNGGSCVFHNTCQCTKDFAGLQCQHPIDRCAPQKIGFNGAISCMGTNTGMSCTLSCPPGVNFDSQPATAYSCSFATGTFTPARVPKCVYGEGAQVIQTMGRSPFDNSQPTCTPSCLNGGSCFFHNLCQCPQNFRGPQCQYSVDRCSIKKKGFNGGFRCSGSSTEMSCTISCPLGVEYEFPPATAYVCKFETGRFTPERIPNCVFGEGVEVIRKTSSSFE